MPSDTKINVLFCTNSEYSLPCLVACISLLENNSEYEFDIRIVGRDLSDDEKDNITQNLDRYENQTHGFMESRLPDMEYVVHGIYSVDIYQRILVDHFFPEKPDKVLYLDSDLVVTGDIGPLWNTEFEGEALAAVPILGSVRPIWLGLPEDTSYFNTGVILFNMKEWRKQKIEERFFDYIGKNAHLLLDPDQDALNAILAGNYRKLSFIWNAISVFFNGNPQVPENIAVNVRRKVRVVHFNGLNKPWLYMSNHIHKNTFLHYADMMIGKKFVPADKTPMNVIKLRLSRMTPSIIKRTIKFILGK